MGEEVINKEESAKAEAEPKKEESAAPEAAPAEEGKKKGEEPPSPPPPVILGVEVHCKGCAKRIRRSLLRCKGVEAVHVDTAANQVTIKGVALDPETLCARLRDKTKRDATVISPLPPPPPPADDGGEAAPPPPPPADDLVRTVELLVNMHCDACAEQLQRKMLKMKGVKGAETDLAAGKLTVTGAVEGEKIVEYIHCRTGKLATVVPPPEDPPKEEEAAPPAEADKPADDKKEDEEKKPTAEGDQPAEEEKKEAAPPGDGKPGKKADGGFVAVDGFPPEELMKRMVYWPYGGAPAHHSYKLQPADSEEARRMAMHAMPPLPPHHHHPYGAMMHQHQWMPPPPPPPPMYYGGSSYMMERPPQMFSDENPNACVIS